jgi:TnpA family transposase
VRGDDLQVVDWHVRDETYTKALAELINYHHRFEKPTTYPGLESFLGGTINVKQMEAHWDDLLRLTGSLRKGTVTASLILGKLASSPRQNGLAWALRE